MGSFEQTSLDLGSIGITTATLQEDSFGSFLDAAPLMMGVVVLEDDDIVHIADNARSAAFFGRTRQELRGARASQLGVPATVIAEWIRHYRRSESTGEPVRFEYLHPDKILCFSVTVRYLGRRPDGGGPGRPRFIYMIEDLTAVKQAQLELERRVRERTEELEAANLRLQDEIRKRRVLETERERLYNLPNHLLCVLDSDSRFRSVNLGFRNTLGYEPEELIGRPIWEFIHPEDLGRSVETEQVGRTTVIHSFENRYRSRDGRYRWLRWTGTVIDGTNYGAAIDVTELKEAEAGLKENLTARDEFLSIASHELKTPLTSLKLQAQLSLRAIERGDPRVYDPARVKALVEQTDRQASRLARLVDDMLDISRIRSGKLGLHFEPVELDLLVPELLERLRPALDEAGIPVSFEVTTPGAAGGWTGQWDRFRIEQVLTNLLTNAMRYGDNKPIALTLGKSDGDFARLAITDRGRGMAPESLDKIFHRFERAVSASEISGLGLGLYISREIVIAHGGRIWAESPGVGKGATFFVELPLAGRPG